MASAANNECWKAHTIALSRQGRETLLNYCGGGGDGGISAFFVAKMCIAYFSGSNLFIHVGKDLFTQQEITVHKRR